MRKDLRCLMVGAALVAGGVGAGGRADAHEPTTPIVVRVVNAANLAHYPATALACPQFNGEFDCGAGAIRQDVNRFGLATLKLEQSVSYRVFAVVANPNPAWSCPGLLVDGDQLYLSNTLEGEARTLPKLAKLVVPEPDPLDCVVVTVTDQFGTSLSAGLFLCAHRPGSEECLEGPYEGADPDGVIRIKVNPELVYDLGAFYATAEWPCPGYPLEDGNQLYFGDSGTFDAGQLLAGVTLVVRKPSPFDCAPVTVTDESGNLLTTAGMWVCGHVPGDTTCVGETSDGSDPDGVIRLQLDPTLDYDLTPWYVTSEWPCPGFPLGDGEFYYGGATVTLTAAAIATGTLTLVVPKPTNC
jgi:hypothetical protein